MEDIKGLKIDRLMEFKEQLESSINGAFSVDDILDIYIDGVCRDYSEMLKANHRAFSVYKQTMDNVMEKLRESCPAGEE